MNRAIHIEIPDSECLTRSSYTAYLDRLMQYASNDNLVDTKIAVMLSRIQARNITKISREDTTELDGDQIVGRPFLLIDQPGTSYFIVIGSVTKD